MSNSFANVCQKKLANFGCNPLAINFLTYFLLAVVSVSVLFFREYHQYSLMFYVYSAIVGGLGALGNAYLIKSLENGDLSVLGPINSYKALVGLVFGVFLLRELPTFVGVLGMLLIIVGSYFVLDTLKERFSFALLKNREIRYRFLALFFSALEAIFIKKVIILSSVFVAFVSWCAFGALFSFLLLKLRHIGLKQQCMLFKSGTLKLVLLLAFFVFLMQYMTNFVFSRMNVAYALSLFQLSALLSVILGYKIFKEKHIKKKLVGSVIMIAGAILIILYN